MRIPAVAPYVEIIWRHILNQERVHLLSRISTLAALAAFAAAAAMACGASSAADARSSSTPTVQAPAPGPEVGSSPGDLRPDFEIRLADGTLVKSESLIAESRPAFLFFFATW